MTIYLRKNDKNATLRGPYMIEEVRDFIRQGEYTEKDLACHDGKSWIAIAQVPGFSTEKGLDHIHALAREAIQLAAMGKTKPALVQARVAAEAVCKGIDRHEELEIKPSDEKDYHDDKMPLLRWIKHVEVILPEPILVHLYGILEHGNLGAHDKGAKNDAHISGESFASCLISLLASVNWYAKEYDAPGEELVYVDAETEADFKCRKLKKFIRKRIKLPKQSKITRRQMASLRALPPAENKKITDLTGIEHAIGLFDLELPQNKIRDLTPLEELYNLRTLNLQSNQITDLTPLKGLTNLGALYLSDNQITDLTPLHGLTDLVMLDLSRNKITEDQKAMLKKALPNCYSLVLDGKYYGLTEEMAAAMTKKEIKAYLHAEGIDDVELNE